MCQLLSPRASGPRLPCPSVTCTWVTGIKLSYLNTQWTGVTEPKKSEVFPSRETGVAGWLWHLHVAPQQQDDQGRWPTSGLRWERSGGALAWAEAEVAGSPCDDLGCMRCLEVRSGPRPCWEAPGRGASRAGLRPRPSCSSCSRLPSRCAAAPGVLPSLTGLPAALPRGDAGTGPGAVAVSSDGPLGFPSCPRCPDVGPESCTRPGGR